MHVNRYRGSHVTVSDMLDKPFQISIVVPCYNEENGIDEFHRRVAAVCDSNGYLAEFIYVNDGSTDDTLAQLQGLMQQSANVVIVDLSRNYGKEIALTAGLDYAKGDVVVPIDADLQDPPELIPEMVEKWREGYNVVYARRRTRAGETWLKKATARLFYRTMSQVGGKVPLPTNVGDFRLIDYKVLNALKQLREHHRFMKGLFSIVGFRQTAIEYDRDPRFADETKWNYWRLWNLSLEAVTSFTIAPLKISTYLGLAVALLAFIYGSFIVGKAVLFGDPVDGFPSIIAVVTLLGGVQLVVLGVLGEYLGRVFNETKNRPLYFVQDVLVRDKANWSEPFAGPTSAQSADIDAKA